MYSRSKQNLLVDQASQERISGLIAALLYLLIHLLISARAIDWYTFVFATFFIALCTIERVICFFWRFILVS